jgi:hypothetical protein
VLFADIKTTKIQVKFWEQLRAVSHELWALSGWTSAQSSRLKAHS